MHSGRSIPLNGFKARDCHRRGVQAWFSNRPEDAIRALRVAVELDPRLVAAWNDLGVFMEVLGNPSEAMICYRRALEARPDSPEATSNLGHLLLQMDLAGALQRQALTSRPLR